MQDRSRAKKPPPKFLDLNLLPEQYRRRRLSLHAARPWALLLAFVLLLFPSYKLYHAANLDSSRVEADLTRIQSVLDNYVPLIEEKDALLAKIEAIESQIDEIETAAQSAIIQEITWGSLLRSIVRMVPAGVELTTVDQSGYEVLIEGVAENRYLTPSLADTLEESGLFASVVINSLVRTIPPEPSGDEIYPSVPVPQYEFEIQLELLIQGEESP